MKTLNAVIRKLSSNTLLLSVVCPFCHKVHHHGSGGVLKSGPNGHRESDCSGTNDGYFLNITQKSIEDSKKLKFGKSLDENSIRGLFYLYNGVFPYKTKDVLMFRERMRRKIWGLHWKSIDIEFREKKRVLKIERETYDDGRSVYFIYCKGLGVVKIGVSNNPSKRMASLQTAIPYPLEILKIVGGGVNEEYRLHKKFSSCRKTGEWFHYSEEIKSFISAL